MPDTFTAKQVASRIGTDAKTLRKFLRSSASPYDAVGHGGRYEFPKDSLAVIKKAFDAWQKGKRPATVPPTTPAPPAEQPKKAAPRPRDPDSARRNREAEEFHKWPGWPHGEVVMEEDEPTEEDLDNIEAGDELEIEW